jgi:hypothetical protein
MSVLKVQRWLWLEPSAVDGAVAAFQGLEAEGLWLIRPGRAPAATRDGEGWSPVVATGVYEESPFYAEQVVRGLPASRVLLSGELVRFVARVVLIHLAEAHQRGRVHGAVSRSAIWLGLDGSVTLVGRGSGTMIADVLGAWALLGAGPEDTLPAHSASDLADMITPGDFEVGRLELIAAVRASMPAQGVVTVPMVLNLSNSETDEVVPDVGPDRSRDGILDRWAATVSVTGETASAMRTAGRSGPVWPAPSREERAPVRRWIELAAAMALGAFVMWLWLYGSGGGVPRR